MQGSRQLFILWTKRGSYSILIAIREGDFCLSWTKTKLWKVCKSCLSVLENDTGSSTGIYACGDTSNEESQKLSSYASSKQEITNWNICP